MVGAHISAMEFPDMFPLHLKHLMVYVGAGVLLACTPRPGFGEAKPVPVKFDTVDLVKLKGLFYPSDKKTDAACVILVHEIGGNIRQKGWKGLGLGLQKQGYAVLS